MADGPNVLKYRIGSAYLSPRRSSPVYHVVVVKGETDEFLCKPNIPIGRWAAQGHMAGPTCPDCITALGRLAH